MGNISYLVALVHIMASVVTAYQWPDPQYEALERLLFEGTDINNVPTSILTNSCGRRVVNGSPVAAEWLRLSYHDAATHNITDGTGGMDASIYYELDRAENLGAGMISSMNDFSAASNKFVSRADLVALGVVWGVASCGGPIIPYRGGRVDATAPGRLGVPQPQEDLSVHTERFRLQGFSSTEMISLVACGHTLGGVRSSDFPTIVQDGGTDSVVHKFDGTDAYDQSIVAEYLNGTAPDPLMTTNNTIFRSDLRIFGSDNNATMQSMNSPATFNATCAALLERVINLVPSGVSLTDEISLLPFKIHQARLTVQNATLVFDVEVRVAVTASEQSAGLTPKVINIFWCDARGPSANCANSTANTAVVTHPTAFNDVLISPVAAAMKTTFVAYEFVLPIDSSKSVGRFWFEVLAGPGNSTLEDNGGAGYAIDDSLIFINELGSASAAQNGEVSFDIVVGLRSQNAPTAASISIFDNTFRKNASTPFSATAPLIPSTNSSLPAISGYSLLTGAFTTPASTAGHPTIDIAIEVDGLNITMNFIRPTGPKDFFPTETTDAVSTTSVSNVPTAVPTTSASGTKSAPTGTNSGAGSLNGVDMPWVIYVAILGLWLVR